MTTTATERIAAPARLEQYRDQFLRPDATLDDALNYLRELSTARLEDLAPDAAPDMRRTIALGHLQGAVQGVALHITSRFSPEVRSAPASGLAEVVRDVLRDCPGTGCPEYVGPWDGSTCGDPVCESQYRRAAGER